MRSLILSSLLWMSDSLADCNSDYRWERQTRTRRKGKAIIYQFILKSFQSTRTFFSTHLTRFFKRILLLFENTKLLFEGNPRWNLRQSQYEERVTAPASVLARVSFVSVKSDWAFFNVSSRSEEFAKESWSLSRFSESSVRSDWISESRLADLSRS